jgi:hypothetical protein
MTKINRWKAMFNDEDMSLDWAKSFFSFGWQDPPPECMF